jgi:hypothetical protein
MWLMTQAAIGPIMDQWRSICGIERSSVVDPILGFDATAIEPSILPGYIHIKQCKNCFVFVMLPIALALKKLVIDVLPYPHGSLEVGGESTCIYFWHLLKVFPINILSIATDGDRSNLPDQECVVRRDDRRFDDEVDAIHSRVF